VRLAETHQALHVNEKEHRRVSGTEQPKSAAHDARPSVPGAGLSAVADEQDQLARAMAEIEKASAALRRSEPALELGLPDAGPLVHTRKYRSVWILIGAIWLSATLVVASATGAILYLFG
jgi:hypothetical protein